MARGQFEEVVVTKIQVARGRRHAQRAGKRNVWVEVVDDRILYARAFIAVDQVDRIAAGGRATVHQGAKAYAGEILSIGALADRSTHLLPVLVKVANDDRDLKIHTEVTVDFLKPGGSSR